MYNNNLAMAVKVDGKVLREVNDKVYLPFGSEYTLYFKNTSSKRCRIKITIDGTDIMDGRNLIVNGNSNATVSRFIKNGNLTEGNSLKFIEKTEAISNHRGDKIEDGLITVVYEFEKDDDFLERLRRESNHFRCMGSLQGNGVQQYRGLVAKAATWTNTATLCDATPQGITAPGSHNTQKFHSASWNGSDGKGSSTMTLQLKGEIEERKAYYMDVGDRDSHTASEMLDYVSKEILSRRVDHSLLTSEKITCSMCGTKHKSSAKFCSECGASLKIY